MKSNFNEFDDFSKFDDFKNFTSEELIKLSSITEMRAYNDSDMVFSAGDDALVALPVAVFFLPSPCLNRSTFGTSEARRGTDELLLPSGCAVVDADRNSVGG